MDYKHLVVEALTVMYQKSIADNERFRAAAYKKVIDQLHSMSKFTSDDLPHLKGAGEKITKKIQEVIKTGELKAAEKAKAEYHLDATEAFTQIYGVGPVKAQQFIEQGIYTIEQLRAEFKRNPSILNVKQLIGLKYYEPLLQRIPYAEMQEHEQILSCALYDVSRNKTGELVGSFRRKAPSSGDIDFIIRGRIDMEKFVSILGKQGYLYEILAKGHNKCMAICCLGTPRRLDILIAPEDEYAYSLLYFTGSAQFNIAFRQHAITLGYTLNEHGMKPLTLCVQHPPPLNTILPATNVVPPMNTEKDIFAFLGLEYVKPEDRVDHRQIKPM